MVQLIKRRERRLRRAKELSRVQSLTRTVQRSSESIVQRSHGATTVSSFLTQTVDHVAGHQQHPALVHHNHRLQATIAILVAPQLGGQDCRWLVEALEPDVGGLMLGQPRLSGQVDGFIHVRWSEVRPQREGGGEHHLVKEVVTGGGGGGVEVVELRGCLEM